MSQSRIKRIRKAAIKLILASPNLTQQQMTKVYQGTIKTMKKAGHQSGIALQKESLRISKKMHPGESLMNFQERRKVCNQKRRERESL